MRKVRPLGTPLPFRESGFNLTKGAFQGAIHFRYGWKLKHLPSSCVCGSSNSEEHVFSCPSCGYTIHRHNEIRDTTAALMAYICREVTVEHKLQPTTGEEFTYRSADTDEDARLGMKAKRLGNGHRTHFLM